MIMMMMMMIFNQHRNIREVKADQSRHVGARWMGDRWMGQVVSPVSHQYVQVPDGPGISPVSHQMGQVSRQYLTSKHGRQVDGQSRQVGARWMGGSPSLVIIIISIVMCAIVTATIATTIQTLTESNFIYIYIYILVLLSV